MFTEEARGRLLDQLLEAARADEAVTTAALVGSLARGDADRWSDIDLALGLASGAHQSSVVDRWTGVVARVAAGSGLRAVADRLDVRAGPALYRVFLLQDSLQVDVSFWPAGTLASTGEPLTLVFGDPVPTAPGAQPDPQVDVGRGWLHALHARSALARGRPWQAVQMLDGLRESVISLACRRHGLPASQGRGVDRLPAALRSALADTLPSGPTAPALHAAFTAGLRLLQEEVELIDPELAARLREPLETLRSSATGT
jgi:nucleotidyltransferase-like protein